MSAVKSIEFTQIATDWDSITLGEENPQALLAIRNGLTTKQNQDKGDYKVSRIETIGGGWIDETRVRFASDLKEKDVEKYRIQKGDILFSHINSDPHLGKTGFAERDYEDLLHGMNLLLIRANPEVFEAAFLNRIFQYYRDIGVFISICSRSVNQSSINQAKLKAVEVPLPPLPEQKKIAHILSTVQRAIEAQEGIIQITTELKKALMHKLFTEGLRNEPQKQTEIGLVPESWEVVELEAKAESFQYGTSVKCGYDLNGKPVLRIPNVVGGHVDPADLKFGKPKKNELGKLSLESGDLLFVRTNGVKENAGRCSKFNGELADCYFASYLIRVRLDPTILNADFLNEYSRTEVGTSFLSGKSIRTADGKFNINSGTLKTMLVPVPTIEEQEEIARTLALLDDKATNALSKKTILQDLFRTLLHELMTAQTRVT
jgi:type I restriction enzyme S subunit